MTAMTMLLLLPIIIISVITIIIIIIITHLRGGAENGRFSHIRLGHIIMRLC
jgi:hypothetical protein